jgi:cytochrome P450
MPKGDADEIFDFYRTVADEGHRNPIQYLPDVDSWLVHRYEHVDRVLSDQRQFSADELRYSTREIPHRDNPMLHSLIATDPPRHDVLKRIVSRLFVPRTIDLMQQLILDTTDRLLDEADQVGRTMDVLDQLARPLPLATTAELLGIEPAMRPDFVRWTDAISSFFGDFTEVDERRTRFRQAVDEMGAYLRAVIAEHRAHPGDDVVDKLLAAEPDGSALTDDELVNIIAALLMAGHDTTKDTIVGLLLCLDRHPEVVDDLRAHPELIPGAVEEALRYFPPAGGRGRWATRPTEIDGHPVAYRQKVIGVIVSANRDERVFADPHRFDVRRSPNPHLSFGKGIHFCMGAYLSRLQIQLAVGRMLQRLPGRWSLPADDMVTEKDPLGIDVVKLSLAWTG